MGILRAHAGDIGCIGLLTLYVCMWCMSITCLLHKGRSPIVHSPVYRWVSTLWCSTLAELSLILHRSAFWLRDGRWRQWEAYDCVNIGMLMFT